MMNPNDCEHIRVETLYQYDRKKNYTLFWGCPSCRMQFEPKGLADAKLAAQNAALLDVVRDCVNFLADMDNKTDRSKALHKRAYTAHSKAKGE